MKVVQDLVTHHWTVPSENVLSFDFYFVIDIFEQVCQILALLS